VTECPLCGQFAPTLSLYISHLRLVHSKDRPFSVVCGIGGCKEVFGTFSGLNTHIYRHHRFALGLEQACRLGVCVGCVCTPPLRESPHARASAI